MQTIKFSFELIFEKKDDMIFFSQIDLLHILQRCLHRSDLPFYCSQGFNPRIKISFLSSLKLGESGQIKTKFYFTQEITREFLIEKLNPQLPLGLKIASCEKIK